MSFESRSTVRNFEYGRVQRGLSSISQDYESSRLMLFGLFLGEKPFWHWGRRNERLIE